MNKAKHHISKEKAYPLYRECVYIFALTLLSVFFSTANYGQVLYKQQVTLMGSVFELTVVDHDTSTAIANVQKAITEVERIENLISEWRPQTQISEVNRHAGLRPVQVDQEVFELTRRALSYSKISNGAFDISIAALDRLWVFDGSMNSVPSAEAIRKSIENVGYQHIVLDSIDRTIFLSRTGMKIGFGSIGKGYAADRARTVLQDLGVQAGIVNASGDLSTWGKQLDTKPWVIGVSHPSSTHRIIQKIKLTDGAVATSGDYQKYVEIDGIRYAHIINPQTGYPATGLSSVTVYGPSAEFANALSTSIMVLGEKKGKDLLQHYPLYRFILITDRGKVIKK